jgi:GDP/UDP-N,N'-diacetylbacillosamine 2-epimerase (hydrolysing)
MTRKICVITGSRADYGLLRWVMQGIKQAPELELQVVACGMHLSPEFGFTYRAIEADGFHIDRSVESLTSSDTAVGMAKSMGLALIGFADALAYLRPNIVVVLGDRSEIHAAVTAAFLASIPVAHLHGGELTQGAIDDAMRHSITKMSHFHFVATNEYRQRVIQLGEQPETVFTVGGLGIDGIIRQKLLSREELEALLNFRFLKRNILVTFHPETLESNRPANQLAELLSALHTLNETGLIFTMPNADTGGRELIRMIEDYVSRNGNAKAFTSLGQRNYLSCVAQVDAVVGNSSSGLLEVPSFRKATLNIGDRQTGRIQAASVINCRAERQSISEGLQKIYSPVFQASLRHVINPYGNGGASEKVVQVLRTSSLKGILKKVFFDQKNMLLDKYQ